MRSAQTITLLVALGSFILLVDAGCGGSDKQGFVDVPDEAGVDGGGSTSVVGSGFGDAGIGACADCIQNEREQPKPPIVK